LIGIMSNALKGHEGRAPASTLDAAKAAGFGGVMFGSLLEASPDLSPVALQQLAADARARDMTVACGISSFNPSNPARNAKLTALGDGDIVKGFAKAIDGAAALGTGSLFFVVGAIEDREDPALPWAEQLAKVTEALIGLRSRAKDQGVGLWLKTHEELTTFEIVRIIEAVGADVMGVSHDPVNLVCRIEDPVLATQRIAPYVKQVHLDDAIVTFDGDTVRRYLADMGRGDLDWPGILNIVGDVPAWVEFHRGQFAMPVFDAAWVAAQPDLALDEYRGIVGTAFRRFNKHEAPSDQSDPYGRLPAAIEWLTTTYPQLAGTTR